MTLAVPSTSSACTGEIYQQVKTLCPETRVFCVFAREITAELREADLSVLGMFDTARLDQMVFTSYPNVVKKDRSGAALEHPINRPSDIPCDSYSVATDGFAGKPFGLSEAGWPSENGFGDEQDQADFLTLAAGTLTRGRGLSLELFGWPWLHDLGVGDQHGSHRDGWGREGRLRPVDIALRRRRGRPIAGRLSGGPRGLKSPGPRGRGRDHELLRKLALHVGGREQCWACRLHLRQYQSRFPQLVAGLALMVYPMFVASATWMLVIGGAVPALLWAATNAGL